MPATLIAPRRYASGISEKADRLLTTSAVQVVAAGETSVTARVRSDHHGLVAVTWSCLDGWHCTCPAFGRCSHVEAVAAVTTRSPRSQPNPKIDECASARRRKRS